MLSSTATASVLAVATSRVHAFSKDCVDKIMLIAGVGVAGDAHSGATVQHRSRLARDPTRPNLRQVHLLHRELLDELNDKGFVVSPGALGENITMSGLDLLALPVGTVLAIGDSALLGVTGLRNPCWQIDEYQRGLLRAVVHWDGTGNLVSRAGIMTVVLAGGEVSAGSQVHVGLPPLPHQPLRRV